MNQLLHLDRSQLFVIAGPCVIESAEICVRVAEHVKRACEKLGIAFIFKASFDKANRTSASSFRGPGLTDGLIVLERVKRELGVPVYRAGRVAEAGGALRIRLRDGDVAESVGRLREVYFGAIPRRMGD